MMIAAPRRDATAAPPVCWLVQMLGFGEAEVGCMFAAYVALESFGTATQYHR
ncbi:hypothetical protein [Microbacterium sp.]|uniref:hypothetical protein n=1 Tax=Microbacterium sp. TaxID=51671 RepID=UPI002811FD1B|nr:hypothetical protein [Microbacterium sp.]